MKQTELETKRITFEDLRKLKEDADKIHDNYMNMCGYFKDEKGSWKGNKEARQGDYEGHANGAFNVRCLIENLIEEKGLL